MAAIQTDQRKRSQEALERRFAVAEAELRMQQQLQHKQQQQEDRYRPAREKHKVFDHCNSSSLDKSSSATACTRNPPKKGNVTFTGYSSSQDIKANQAAYSRIFHHIDESVMRTHIEMSNSGDTVKKILHELLRSGDSAQKYMHGSKSMKIDNWILLDNVVQERRAPSDARLRAFQRHSKRSKKHMSMSKLKKSGALHLPHELHKYEIYKPMHEMWKDYTKHLLKNVGKNHLAQCLLSADLHGAMILVVECKIASFTGVSGIMIRETAETFGIVSEDNEFEVVPKKMAVFMLQVDCWKVTLHGDKLSSRNILS